MDTVRQQIDRLLSLKGKVRPVHLVALLQEIEQAGLHHKLLHDCRAQDELVARAMADQEAEGQEVGELIEQIRTRPRVAEMTEAQLQEESAKSSEPDKGVARPEHSPLELALVKLESTPGYALVVLTLASRDRQFLGLFHGKGTLWEYALVTRRLHGLPEEPEVVAALETVRGETVDSGAGDLAVAAKNAASGGEDDGVGPDESPPKPRFLFARDGDGYAIEGFGEHGHFKKLKGFEYIEALLKEAGKPVPMVQLVREGLGEIPSEDSLEDEERSAVSLTGSTRHPVWDQQTWDDVNAKQRELDSDLESARKGGNQAEIDELEKEKGKLDGFANATTRAFGRGRDMSFDSDRLRSRIKMALNKAYKELRESSLPVLADHFQKAIAADGPTYKYGPVPVPEWRFSEKIQRVSRRLTQ